MIDEELYQQAADELNSDRRRPHIWARACALASDDHDEARYLYTNLRVEELIAEREINGPGEAPQNIEATDDVEAIEAIVATEVVETIAATETDEHDTTLALEPIPLDYVGDRVEDGASDGEDIAVDKGNGDDGLLSSMDSDSPALDAQDVIPESFSAPSGIDGPEASDDFLQLLADEKLKAEALSSERAGFEERMERHFEQQSGFTAPDADPDVAEIDESADDDKSLEEDFLDSYEEHQENIKAAAREQSPEEFINELELSDTDVSADQRLSSAHDEQLDLDGPTEFDLDPDEIAKFYGSDQNAVSAVHGRDGVDEERHIDANDKSQNDDSLSWLDDESSINLPATQPGQPSTPSEKEHDRLAQELERQADQLPGQHSDVIEHSDWAAEDQVAAYAGGDAIPKTPDLAPPHDTAAGDHIDAQTYDLPVDLTLGQSGREFAIYKRYDDKIQAVSTGVSWSALFFTLPFLIYRHLFGTAILYSLLWVIALGGLLLNGLAWMDAGSTATMLNKASTIGFALLAIIGLLYIPFRYGNTWRGEKLERRDFELVAWVRASTPGKALVRARRAVALD